MAGRIEFRVNPKPARCALERLWREVWQDTALPDFERMIQHGLLHVGAFDADVLVGFANAAHDGAAHAFLSDLCVAPGYQRKGIGSRLAAIAINPPGPARRGSGDSAVDQFPSTVAALPPPIVPVRICARKVWSRPPVGVVRVMKSNTRPSCTP